MDETPTTDNRSQKPEFTLLDELVEDDDDQDIKEIMEVPGTYFLALWSA